MTFIDIYSNASNHFGSIPQPDDMAILVRYAKEELQLADTDIPAFLVRTDFTTITKDNYRTTGDFLAWYYVNYMSEIKLAVPFDVRIVGTPRQDFSILGIQPQRMDTSTGEPRPRPCQGEDAEFHGIYIEDILGHRQYLAHCRDRDTALRVCTLLKAFGYRWIR